MRGTSVFGVIAAVLIGVACGDAGADQQTAPDDPGAAPGKGAGGTGGMGSVTPGGAAGGTATPPPMAGSGVVPGSGTGGMMQETGGMMAGTGGTTAGSGGMMAGSGGATSVAVKTVVGCFGQATIA